MRRTTAPSLAPVLPKAEVATVTSPSGTGSSRSTTVSGAMPSATSTARRACS